MEIFQREYRGEKDTLETNALVRRNPESNLHVVSLPYRFSSWAYDDPGKVALWVDEAGSHGLGGDAGLILDERLHYCPLLCCRAGVAELGNR